MVLQVSGFTFAHNALNGGYPIVEAIETVRNYVDDLVVVDMESNDGTRDLLERLPVKIVDGKWGNEAGKTLADAHLLNVECMGDVVIHFEADEIYDLALLERIINLIHKGYHDISIERLQIEQNFQRIRWYPHLVHRVFPKGSVNKNGETTFEKDRDGMVYLDAEYGYLWDCTNCFKDNWLKRIEQQSELRNGEPLNTLFVPEHCNLPNRLQLDTDNDYFDNDVWTSKYSPLDLPYAVQHLLGVQKYEPEL